jgi:hypothetical protein
MIGAGGQTDLMTEDHRPGFIKPFQTSETLLANKAMARSASVCRRFRKRSITSRSNSNIIGREPFKKSI